MEKESEARFSAKEQQLSESRNEIREVKQENERLRKAINEVEAINSELRTHAERHYKEVAQVRAQTKVELM